MLVGNMAVPSDDEGLRHPIDPPVDGYPTVTIGAGTRVRIAHLARPDRRAEAWIATALPIRWWFTLLILPLTSALLLDEGADLAGSGEDDRGSVAHHSGAEKRRDAFRRAELT